MAQNTILAAGTTIATSSDVVVAAGSVVTIGLFVASGDLPVGCSAIVLIDTPGADLRYAPLDKSNPLTVVSGPCTARVTRQEAGGTAVGVFSET